MSKTLTSLQDKLKNPNIRQAFGPIFLAIIERKATNKLQENPHHTLSTLLEEIGDEEKKAMHVATEKFLQKQKSESKRSTEIEDLDYEDKMDIHCKNAAILFHMANTDACDKKRDACISELKNPYYKKRPDHIKKEDYLKIVNEIIKPTPSNIKNPTASYAPLHLTKISKTLQSTKGIVSELWKNTADKALALQRGTILSRSEEIRKKDARQGAKMLTPSERKKYECIVSDGLLKKSDGMRLDTSGYESHSGSGLAACVINTEGEISFFEHKYGYDLIWHASLNAGKAVLYAGDFEVRDGKLISISQCSGHYKPSLMNMLIALELLKKKGVDISNVELFCIDTMSGLDIEVKELKREHVRETRHIYRASDLPTVAYVESRLFLNRLEQTIHNLSGPIENTSPPAKIFITGCRDLYKKIDDLGSYITSKGNRVFKQSLNKLVDASKKDVLQRAAAINNTCGIYGLKRGIENFNIYDYTDQNAIQSYFINLKTLDFTMTTIGLINKMMQEYVDYAKGKFNKYTESGVARIKLANDFATVLSASQKQFIDADSPEKLSYAHGMLNWYFQKFKSACKNAGVGKENEKNLSNLIKKHEDDLFALYNPPSDTQENLPSKTQGVKH